MWSGTDYQHVKDIDDTLKDSEIWKYAKENSLTIVTKDADFSDFVLMSEPPPRVIHVKLGNMKIRDFHQHLTKIWKETEEMSQSYKLVRIDEDRIEGID